MTTDPGFRMYVFRDGRRVTSIPRLRDELCAELSAIASVADVEDRRRRALGALIRAGELECVLADRAAPEAAFVSRSTDALSGALLGGPLDGEAAEALARIDVPASAELSAPEGFAYYALHPLAFEALTRDLVSESGRVAVVGIRSIGTTLSAIVAALLRHRGLSADRRTVRPLGHPYDRRLEFDADALGWIEARREADFVVVDEGPGLSGSSFLATAEALVRAGIPRERIVLWGNRDPDPDALVARDGARRWRSFRASAVREAKHLPAGAAISIAGGAWRGHFYEDPSRWPASWISMERLKFLSPGKDRLFKFEGLGRFGAAALARARAIADAGFGPEPRDEGDGFLSYPVLPGRPLSIDDLTRPLLDRLARYCAFRAAAFPEEREVCVQGAREIATMARTNHEAAFGAPLETELALEIVRPAMVDGRMMPHEWIDAPGGARKVDATTHGDDHFFPGPTDIAWDLAGVIVEWNLDPEARAYFLERYREASGDRPEARLSGHLAAYTLFRIGYTGMAAASLRGSEEAARLERENARYRYVWSSLLRSSVGE
ncbi:phosphotransferase family protein [Polyangium aurulentum]|uniref:phosphotransferase family protein n=1 Tax=Polyangium aurulentum TaxID=2567896 RepID=UPI00146C1C3B|nr:hypothetical protein [Polyangium aurulentum]UQA56393.1 hypothetical protein E8A73_034510 [Polyangium aurulentum]